MNRPEEDEVELEPLKQSAAIQVTEPGRLEVNLLPRAEICILLLSRHRLNVKLLPVSSRVSS